MTGQHGLAEVALDVVDTFRIFRHVVDETHQYVQCIVCLVVLGTDVAAQIACFSGYALRADECIGCIGHGAFFADFVQNDAGEVKTEVLVECATQHVVLFVSLLHRDVEVDLGLFCIVVRQEVDGVFGHRHHVLCLWGVGRAFVGHQWEVLAQDIVYLVEGECSGEEHLCLVVGGAVDVARQF